MATTFTLELKKVPTSQGKYPIFIRITKDRKHKRIKTSVELSRIADWNPNGAKNHNWVRTSERNAGKWNDALAIELEEASDVYRDNKQVSVEAIANRLKGIGTSNSFLGYMKMKIETLEKEGRSNAKHYGTLYNKFEAYLASIGRTDIAFNELTPAMVGGFESFLHKEINAKLKKETQRLHTNYIRTILIKLKAMINKAIAEELIPEGKNPFSKHKLPKEEPAHKEALTESEMESIKALEYPEGSLLWHTKNAFLFSFYCAGIRAGDMLQLRWRNISEGSKLNYKMGKNHKEREFVLVSQAKEILALYYNPECRASDYIFPLLDSGANYARQSDVETMPVAIKKQLFSQIYSKNALLNKYLKKIAKDAGIDKVLSFHISRHTFASWAIGKGISSKVTQEALAHSSLATTERYMHSFSNGEVDKALDKMFSSEESRQERLLQALKELDQDSLAIILDKLDTIKGN